MQKPYKRIEGNLYQLQDPAQAQKEADAEKFYDQGLYAKESGCPDAALAFYRKALSLAPAFVSAWINLGTLQCNRRNFLEARTCYYRAVRVDPNSGLAWFNIANILEYEGYFEEAVDCYQRALAVSSEYVDAHYNLALVYRRLGEYRKEAKHFALYLKYTKSQDCFSKEAQATLKRLKKKDLCLVQKLPSRVTHSERSIPLIMEG